MTTDRRNTDPVEEFFEAFDRYIVARETPGVPSQKLLDRARHARQRCKQECEARTDA